jgi:hypothetical protein
MVLKVVRGKILETLELSLRWAALNSVLELRVRIEAGAIVSLSKNLNYLIDNLYSSMLSVAKGVVKKKKLRLGLRFPNSGTDRKTKDRPRLIRRKGGDMAAPESGEDSDGEGNGAPRSGGVRWSPSPRGQA